MSPLSTMTVWIKAMRLYYSRSRMAWADSLQLGGGGAALVAQCILETWGLAASEDHGNEAAVCTRELHGGGDNVQMFQFLGPVCSSRTGSESFQ